MEAADLSVRDFALVDPAGAGETSRVVRGRVTRAIGTDALPAVLVVHGFKGFLRWGFFPELQRRIARAGWAAVAVNLSGGGVGEDLESFTEDEAFLRSTPSRDVEDVERVRRAIDSAELPELEGLDVARLALFGHSRGGGTVSLHAERRGDYRAVVTWASVARSNRFPPQAESTWREVGYLEIPNARTGQTHRLGVGFLEDCQRNADALDILAACARSRTPTLLVHGTADEAVPLEEGRALHGAFQPGVAEWLEVEGAGHTFGAVHPFQGCPPELERALERTIEFLRSHLTTPRARG